MAKLDDFVFRHEGLIHTFKIEATEAKHASQLAGRKIFKDTECLEILIPGSKNQVNYVEVTDDLLDTKGIREFYEKWKAGEDSHLSGTPIAHFEDLTPGQVKSLEANGFKTIEAFAEMDDSLLTIVGPQGRTLRDKARVVIGFSADEGVKALRAENDAMKSQLEEMRAQIAALAGKPEGESEKRKPGRPPKARTADETTDPFATEAA